MSKIIFSLFFLFVSLVILNSNSHACGYWRGDPAGTWHGWSDYGCPYRRPPVQEKYQNLPGAELYQSKGCTACHTIGQGDKAGPDLMGLFSRRTEDWVKNFISDPSRVLKTDTSARQLKAQYTIEMPNSELTKQEISQIINFLKAATK